MNQTISLTILRSAATAGLSALAVLVSQYPHDTGLVAAVAALGALGIHAIPAISQTSGGNTMPEIDGSALMGFTRPRTAPVDPPAAPAPAVATPDPAAVTAPETVPAAPDPAIVAPDPGVVAQERTAPVDAAQADPTAAPEPSDFDQFMSGLLELIGKFRPSA